MKTPEALICPECGEQTAAMISESIIKNRIIRRLQCTTCTHQFEKDRGQQPAFRIIFGLRVNAVEHFVLATLCQPLNRPGCWMRIYDLHDAYTAWCKARGRSTGLKPLNTALRRLTSEKGRWAAWSKFNSKVILLDDRFITVKDGRVSICR